MLDLCVPEKIVIRLIFIFTCYAAVSHTHTHTHIYTDSTLRKVVGHLLDISDLKVNANLCIFKVDINVDAEFTNLSSELEFDFDFDFEFDFDFLVTHTNVSTCNVDSLLTWYTFCV